MIFGGLFVYLIEGGLLNRKNEPADKDDKHKLKTFFLEHLLRMNLLKVNCVSTRWATHA
jgi:hypothetical protein